MSSSMGDVNTKQSISHAFYTYAHINKVTNKIFYIGKGSKNRYKSIYRRSKHWNSIVEKYGFTAEILANWNTEKEAFEHEKVLIACFKDLGYVLANKTDGGEGTASDKIRQSALKRPKRVLSEETKKKIGLAQLGKKRSQEAKNNMKIAAVNRSKPQRPPCKESTKELLSNKLKGRIVTKEWREKISITKKLANREQL
jgi:hypothetical protein